MEQQIQAINVQLKSSQNQVAELSSGIDRVRAEASQAVYELKEKIKVLEGKGKKTFNLISSKDFAGGKFGGGKNENFKPWSKKVKVFCNAHKTGFKRVLEKVELDEDQIVDVNTIAAMDWEDAIEANEKLYD